MLIMHQLKESLLTLLPANQKQVYEAEKMVNGGGGRVSDCWCVEMGKNRVEFDPPMCNHLGMLM